jgi:hypothetical protein
VHAPTLIVRAPPIFWHHVHSKKDHKRARILAHSSSRTRENTNEPISPRNETKPKQTRKRPGKSQWLKQQRSENDREKHKKKRDEEKKLSREKNLS